MRHYKPHFKIFENSFGKTHEKHISIVKVFGTIFVYNKSMCQKTDIHYHLK